MSTLIKVGGSLLSLPDLGACIERLLASLNDDRIALLAGGGEAADAVREWDRVFHFEPTVSHQLAIESMSLTASLVSKILGRTQLCRSRVNVDAVWRDGRIAVLDVSSLLAELETLGCEPLPAGWHVTSDSIAGWVAVHWPFERLVMAKSVEAPFDLADSDAVDAYFPNLMPKIPSIMWCNLRAERLVCAECKTR